MLKEQITEDMKSAMRAKDSARLSTLRMLLAAVKQKEVDERITVGDGELVAIIDKLIKQRRDSIAAYQAAQRPDLADKEAAEVAVLQAYLPKRLSAEEITAAVTALALRLQAQGPADMGRMMAAAKAELAGQADMAQVSQSVKAVLAGLPA